MLVTGGWGTTTWTVVRGYAGTTAAAHANGDFVTGSATVMFKLYYNAASSSCAAAPVFTHAVVAGASVSRPVATRAAPLATTAGGSGTPAKQQQRLRQGLWNGDHPSSEDRATLTEDLWPLKARPAWGRPRIWGAGNSPATPQRGSSASPSAGNVPSRTTTSRPPPSGLPTRAPARGGRIQRGLAGRNAGRPSRDKPKSPTIGRALQGPSRGG